jgi:pimeloyl-ACP methyl ester carboxylesterase
MPDGTPWQCATLTVPLDHGRPDGETIELALIRAQARPQDGQERLGSLVFNFGGPGGSGVTGLPAMAQEYRELHARYDLVSFDPRGVGASAPVHCLDDKDREALIEAVPSKEDPDAETLAEIGASYIPSCAKNSGKILPHVGTADAARDMDLLRHVLGDDKLDYVGTSYGTELGGVYAHLFPQNVGRFVFDAVVDPTQDDAQEHLAQVKGFQLALDHYLEDCARQPGCPAGRNVEEGRAYITELLERLEDKPLPAGDRLLTRNLATTAIRAALYSREAWPVLTQGLEEVEQQGTGTTLVAIADLYNGRDAQGRYSNMGDAFTAISCADSKQRYTEADVEAMLPALREASPVFGEDSGGGLLACTGWPVTGRARDPGVSAPGSAPILVVGNTGDPATPYAGAERMADELGEDVGVRLTYKGQGHGSYGVSSCVTKAVDTYLLDGELPKDGTVCTE